MWRGSSDVRKVERGSRRKGDHVSNVQSRSLLAPHLSAPMHCALVPAKTLCTGRSLVWSWLVYFSFFRLLTVNVLKLFGRGTRGGKKNGRGWDISKTGAEFGSGYRRQSSLRDEQDGLPTDTHLACVSLFPHGFDYASVAVFVSLVGAGFICPPKAVL